MFQWARAPPLAGDPHRRAIPTSYVTLVQSFQVVMFRVDLSAKSLIKLIYLNNDSAVIYNVTVQLQMLSPGFRDIPVV